MPGGASFFISNGSILSPIPNYIGTYIVVGLLWAIVVNRTKHPTTNPLCTIYTIYIIIPQSIDEEENAAARAAWRKETF